MKQSSSRGSPPRPAAHPPRSIPASICGSSSYVLRVHFGDRGDGQNSCLSFDECKDTEELPGRYQVDTLLVNRLLQYLRGRDYAVGKFTSWGLPILPWRSTGSNCGDAFVETLGRLGVAAEALPDLRIWIHRNNKGKWAYERGRRHPTDDFFKKHPVTVRP